MVDHTIYAGIDPGVTAAGVVLKTQDGEIVRTAVLSATKEDFPALTDQERACAMARAIVDEAYPAGVVTIETPIYNRNPKGFALQSWLFGAICAEIMAASNEFIKLVFVGPTQVKAFHAGSGKATKLDMVCAGSFDGPGYESVAVQEALADAEAICDYGRAHPDLHLEHYLPDVEVNMLHHSEFST